MSYNAWHSWALANYQAAGHADASISSSSTPASLRRATVSNSVTDGVTGDTNSGMGKGQRASSRGVTQQAEIYQAAAVRGFFRSVLTRPTIH
jgi:hypothetical protein